MRLCALHLRISTLFLLLYAFALSFRVVEGLAVGGDLETWLVNNNYLGTTLGVVNDVGTQCLMNPVAVSLVPSIADITAMSTIPSQVAYMTNLTYLGLYHNKITGKLPTELGLLTGLKNLLLHQNKITGRIPSQLALMTSLSTLWLQNNRLSSTIPVSLITLPTDADGFRLANNTLCTNPNYAISTTDAILAKCIAWPCPYPVCGLSTPVPIIDGGWTKSRNQEPCTFVSVAGRPEACMFLRTCTDPIAQGGGKNCTDATNPNTAGDSNAYKLCPSNSDCSITDPNNPTTPTPVSIFDVKPQKKAYWQENGAFIMNILILSGVVMCIIVFLLVRNWCAHKGTHSALQDHANKAVELHRASMSQRLTTGHDITQVELRRASAAIGEAARLSKSIKIEEVTKEDHQMVYF